MTPLAYDVVIPTAGRPSLARLLSVLAAGSGPRPRRVVVVDDRRARPEALLEPSWPRPEGTEVVPGGARGPAAARNIGWRSTFAPWVAFLDDDVVPGLRWAEQLAADLAPLAPDVAGSQGRLVVPLPTDRRPTDWERNVAGLERARWATADMAYRRRALADVGGFDEGFRRAYREDADLAARLLAAGWRLVVGERVSEHPVGPAGRWVSLNLQAGNADDARLRRRSGRRWREVTGAGTGRRHRHAAMTAAGLGALAAAASGRRAAARAGALVWGAGTAELAWSRVRPGPRTPDEVLTMVATSVAIPPLAIGHWLAGWARLLAEGTRAEPGEERRPDAVLFDRDGTLVVDVPYNGDPEAVVPAQGAQRALARLRTAGVPTAVITNQSGVARGLLTEQQVEAVNRRVEELLGPLGPWLVCTHGPDDGCGCRKPEPGLVLRAAEALGVEPDRVAVVGDIGADVEAARAAGARAILVPTAATLPEEVAGAPEVAPDLEAAVDLLLGAAGSHPVPGGPR